MMEEWLIMNDVGVIDSGNLMWLTNTGGQKNILSTYLTHIPPLK